MKTTNLIIGVLTVAVVTLSYMLYSSHNKQCENPNNMKDMIVCKDTLISTDGEITEWNIVKPSIDSFDVNAKVRAFHIGLKNMEHLMAKIKEHNIGLAPSNMIVGLRFYRTTTTRKFVTIGGGLRTVENEPDLIVVPTLAEKNLHEVIESADVPIYWHLRPCPRLCRKKSE